MAVKVVTNGLELLIAVNLIASRLLLAIREV